MSCVASRRHLGLLQRFGKTKKNSRDAIVSKCSAPGLDRGQSVSMRSLAFFGVCNKITDDVPHYRQHCTFYTRSKSAKPQTPQIHAMSRRGALQVFQGAQLQFFSVSSRTNVLVKDPQRLVVGEQIERRCATSPRLSDLPIALTASHESEWRFVHFWTAWLDVDGIAPYQTELTCAWCHISLEETTAPTIPVPWIPLPGDMSAGPSKHCEWYQPTSRQASLLLDKPRHAFWGWRRPRHSTRLLFAGRGLVGRTQSHCIEREGRLATCFLVACSVAGDSQPLQDIESFSACEWECLREKKPRPNQYNVISTGKYPTNISPLPLLRC